MMLSILVVSLFVYGIKVVLNGFFDFFNFDLMVFYERQPMLAQFILRPTIYCSVCMSSVWGSIGYFITCEQYCIKQHIITIVACTALVTILTKLVDD